MGVIPAQAARPLPSLPLSRDSLGTCACPRLDSSGRGPHPRNGLSKNQRPSLGLLKSPLDMTSDPQWLQSPPCPAGDTTAPVLRDEGGKCYLLLSHVLPKPPSPDDPPVPTALSSAGAAAEDGRQVAVPPASSAPTPRAVGWPGPTWGLLPGFILKRFSPLQAGPA